MSKKLTLLFASSALLLSACNNVQVPNNDGDGDGDPAIIEDDEFSEFNLLSSSSTYGRKMVGNAAAALVKNFDGSSAVKIDASMKNGNIDINAIENVANPRYNLHENIKDISSTIDMGVSGYSVKEKTKNTVNDLIGYLNVGKFNAESNLSYQISDDLLNEDSKTETTITNRSKIENGKLDFYLKNNNLYGDLSDSNLASFLSSLSDISEVAGEDYAFLNEIAENPKFAITKLFAENEFSIYDEIADISPMLLEITSNDVVTAIEMLDKKSNEDLKNEISTLFGWADIKFYSAIQKSDYYFKTTFNIDSVDEFVSIVDYAIDKSNEETEDYVPSDIKKDLADKNIELKKTNISGEIRFTKSGNVELDVTNDIELTYVDDIDLSKFEDFKVSSISVDSTVKFSSDINVNLAFKKDTSYLNKLPSDEELAVYHEIDGEKIRDLVDDISSELFHTY